MMLTGLRIPVFFMNDLTENMDLAELDFPLSTCDIREMYFYEIAGISIYYDEEDNNREYSIIHSNGSTFYTPLLIEELKEKIDGHLYNSLFFLKS